MAHIIHNTAKQTLGKPYVAVKVQVKGNKLIVLPEGVSILNPETKISILPQKFKVFDCDGEEINPTKNFYITANTINPYHFLIDM